MASILRFYARAKPRKAMQTLLCAMTTRSYSSEMRPLYHWQDENVEELEGYSADGYHPVHLGEEYCHGRYRIVHKLGYGSSSTVWLARDSVAGRYVSLKIDAAEDSEHDSGPRVFNEIQRQALIHPGRKFISSSLDNFWITGPNGSHLCTVSDVLGPNLQTIRSSFSDLLPLKVARKVTVQLALGLAYIHSCDIVHGGLSLSVLLLFKVGD